MARNKEDAYFAKNFIRRLLNASSPYGYICGFEVENGFQCVDVIRHKNPFTLSGLSVIGYYTWLQSPDVFSNAEASDDLIYKYCSHKCIDQNELSETHLIIILCPTSEVTKAVAFRPRDENVVPLKVHLEHSFMSDVFLFRAKCNLPLMFEVQENEGEQKKNIKDAIAHWQSVFHKNIPVFYYESSKTILRYACNNSESCRDFVKRISEEPSDKQKKNLNVVLEKDAINFDILLQTTGQTAIENGTNHSMVIYRYLKDFLCLNLHLPVDVTIAVKGEEKLSGLYEFLVGAIDQLLLYYEDYLLEYCKINEYPDLEVLYFYPYQWPLPVSIVMPREKSEDELLELRKKVSNALLVSLDHPYFRRTNKYLFSDEAQPLPYLVCPHLALQSSGVVDGKVRMVDGKYIYYHYMQDHMNDDGWGCAYRSFQTIFSYFKFHGYTDRPVPTHTEIQKALVEIGDKESSFVGSRQWIGSQEVSYCLDHFLKVQSRILSVNSGDDLATLGSNLLYHFEKHGAPIMIGGGVLAHTIIGVDFNSKSGDIKLLVLDPHYTGAENLNVVINKGWCGWKNVNFWKKNSFYNLCLPQKLLLV